MPFFGLLSYHRVPPYYMSHNMSNMLKTNSSFRPSDKCSACLHHLPLIYKDGVNDNTVYWLNSEFIPWNGKIFEFQKKFIAIWFGIQYYPYAEILGRLRAVCPKKSSKTWYRYRRPCIWRKSFKIELFTKNKSCSGFSMKNCWTVKFFVPRFSSTLEYRVF